MLAELNSCHAIPDHVAFVEGAGGLPVAAVQNALATAEIHLHGAHVAAFQPRDQRPVLWMSRDAIFSPPLPIRGGVPICWPWFGTPPDHPGRTQHGFARNRRWTVRATRVTEAGETEIIFGLKDDAESLSRWPHAFDLSYAVIIGTTLTIALTFANLSDTPAEVGAALHTYFAVGDVEKIRISGLADRQYHDQLAGMEIRQQSGDILIAEEVDRIYIDTEDDCVIHDETWNRRIRVGKVGSRSTVVWNPWIEKSRRMPDYPDDGYPEMVCIETTNAAGDVRTIAPGESHTMAQTLAVECPATPTS